VTVNESCRGGEGLEMIGMRFVGDVEEAPATQSTTVDVVHQSRQKLVEERPVAPAGGVVLPAEDFPLPAVTWATIFGQ